MIKQKAIMDSKFQLSLIQVKKKGESQKGFTFLAMKRITLPDYQHLISF